MIKSTGYIFLHVLGLYIFGLSFHRVWSLFTCFTCALILHDLHVFFRFYFVALFLLNCYPQIVIPW